MKIVDAIATILKHEGVKFLSCFPTTPIIQACAAAGIRPQVCAQERVGVGIADGYSRITNGNPVGVFAMQYGPGAENAYPGVATAFSDSSPVLLLPLGHAADRQGVFPLFRAEVSFASVTKQVEQIGAPARTVDAMRRAIAALRAGRPGPVMVEVLADVAVQEADGGAAASYRPIAPTRSAGDPRDVEAAARALCAAERPVILAGQGVLYAEATDRLVELSELVAAPTMTTLLGKSAFPESHPLSLGCGTGVMALALHRFVERADLILAIGSSLTRHPMSMP